MCTKHNLIYCFDFFFFGLFVLRYKYRKVSQMPEEKLQEFGFKPSDQIKLEDEFEKMKAMDIDTWEQVRGPRPWEETFDEEKK